MNWCSRRETTELGPVGERKGQEPVVDLAPRILQGRIQPLRFGKVDRVARAKAGDDLSQPRDHRLLGDRHSDRTAAGSDVADRSAVAIVPRTLQPRNTRILAVDG